MRFNYLFICLILTTAFACKKYEDGPYLSIISKKERIKNEWQIEQVVQQESPNTVSDATALYAGITINLDTDTAIISFPLDGNTEELRGNWALDENNTALTWNVAGDTTFALLDSMERFDILRLTEKQFWIAYDKFGEYRILRLKD